ncbi:hypothetical protein [Kitasatospora sp. NPDC051164]
MPSSMPDELGQDLTYMARTVVEVEMSEKYGTYGTYEKCGA